MRRFLLMLMLAAVVGVPLAVPVVSSAASYRVFTISGRYMGKVSYSDNYTATVTNKSGSKVGYLVGQDSEVGHFYYLQKQLYGSPIAYVDRTKVYRTGSGGAVPEALIGKVVKSGSRWIVLKKVSGGFRKVGKISGRCRSPYAIGAGRRLLW